MNEYDAALKRVMQPGSLILQLLTPSPVVELLNVELPAVRGMRADLLGRMADDDLIHIELQSRNDSTMALRMSEYANAIQRRFGRSAHQLVLYVGELPMRMTTRIEGRHGAYECPFVDIREFDSEPFIASSVLGDNVLAILTKLKAERDGIRRILRRISEGTGPGERERAVDELMVLAALRSLATIIEEEVRQVPLLDDIADHPVIGREYKRGKAEGREEGERQVLSRQLSKRFGQPPEWAEKRLANMKQAELEDVALRLLDAQRLEDVFPQ